MKEHFDFKEAAKSIAAFLPFPIMQWVHHLFISYLNPTLNLVFTLVMLPSALAVITVWVRGDIPTSKLFLYAFISMLVFAVLTGIVMGNTAFDIQLHDTIFVVSNTLIIAVIGLLLGLIAFVYFIFPKLFGRQMNYVSGRVHFFITLFGGYCIFLAMNFTTGLPHRYYSYTNFETFNNFNLLAEIISVIFLIVVLAQVIFLFNFIYSIFAAKVDQGSEK